MDDLNSPNTARKPCLVKMNKSKSSFNLFVMHPGGGLTVPYIPLVKGLESIISAYGVQAPGLFSAMGSPVLEDAIANYVADIKQKQAIGPYFLMGWSYGGALAYEVASRLSDSGDDIAYLAILDFPPVFGTNLDNEALAWHQYAAPLFEQRMGDHWSRSETQNEELGITLIAEVLLADNPNKQAMFESVCRKVQYEINESRWFSAYRASKSRLDLDVFVAGKTDKQEQMKSQFGISDKPYEEQWQKHTKGKVNGFEASGSHMTMINSPFVDDLIEALRARIKVAISQIVESTS